MKITILGETIEIQERLMVLGLNEATKLSMLESGEKVYLPDDRPRVDGELFEVVIKEFAPMPLPSIRNQYIDAIRGHTPDELKYEPIEKRRYIII